MAYLWAFALAFVCPSLLWCTETFGNTCPPKDLLPFRDANLEGCWGLPLPQLWYLFLGLSLGIPWTPNYLTSELLTPAHKSTLGLLPWVLHLRILFGGGQLPCGPNPRLSLIGCCFPPLFEISFALGLILDSLLQPVILPLHLLPWSTTT